MPQMHCNFFSYALGHGADLTITLPGVSPCDMDDPALLTHQMPEKFPVLYLLHGHGNDYLSWERFTCVSRYAEEYRIAVVSASWEILCIWIRSTEKILRFYWKRTS